MIGASTAAYLLNIPDLSIWFCRVIVQLGTPGHIVGFDIDTANFNGKIGSPPGDTRMHVLISSGET
jgi:hypothetical protein